MTEDEMFGWHQQLNGHISLNKFWEMVKVQRSLACYSPWGRKELDMTEQLKNNTTTTFLLQLVISPWKRKTRCQSLLR